MSWDFKFGIEEEYFVNDASKRDIAKGKIKEFFEACREDLSDDIQPEMLEPQIEIATKRDRSSQGSDPPSGPSPANTTSRSWPRARTRWPYGHAYGPTPSPAMARSCTTCRW
jgi:hypothetical protein